MKFNILSSIILTTLLFVGCTRRKNVTSQPPAFAWDLKHRQNIHILNLAEAFSNERIIPLTMKDSSKLVSISKVLVGDSTYFILDKKFAQLCRFDKNGKELVKYGEVGMQPGQFRKISDFDVRDDQLAILSNDDKAIFYYNVSTGKFIRKLDIGIYGSSIALLPGDSTLVYINQNRNDNSKNYNVLLIDRTGSIADRYFDIGDNPSMSLMFSGFLTRTNNQAFYAQPFGNTIYRYRAGIFEPYINVGINSDRINANINNLKNLISETVLRDTSTSYLESNFLGNNNYFIVAFQDDQIVQFCFYDIKQHQPKVLNKSLVKDPVLRLMSNPRCLTNDNDVVFNVSPETVFYLKTSLPEIYEQLSVADKRILDKVDKNSNQLLMVAKLK